MIFLNIKMIYGIDKYGQKVYPKPGIKASCILCGATLIPKCGSINIWHWAHQRHYFDCDYEPETLWHLQWKIYVQDHYGYNCEVPIEKNGKGRLADAITNTGQVIEFQHSHRRNRR